MRAKGPAQPSWSESRPDDLPLRRRPLLRVFLIFCLLVSSPTAAAASGAGSLQQARQDADFASLRGEPCFQQLAAGP